MNVCSPTVADDMVLLALSVAGLLCLLCICYAYSCKWRYEYSVLKSSVIVYNETKYDYMKSKRVCRFGNDIIKENENYKHLGIINNKYLSKRVNNKDVTDTLKGTYFSLANSGILLQEKLTLLHALLSLEHDRGQTDPRARSQRLSAAHHKVTWWILIGFKY